MKAVMTLILLGGCGALVPMEKREVSTTAAAERAAFASTVGITKEGLGLPPVTANIRGQDNTVYVLQPQPLPGQVRIDSVGDAQGRGNFAGTFSSIASIPLFVKLIGLAIGLAMLAALAWLSWQWLSKTLVGRGIKLAASAAEVGLAPVMSSIEARLQAAKTSEEQASLAMTLAEVNKARGKLAKGV